MRLLGSPLRWLSLLWFAALAIALAPAARATPIYYLGSDGGSAVTQIDAADPASWSFTATSDWTLGGAHLSLAARPATSAGLTLSLYQGQDASGTLLTPSPCPIRYSARRAAQGAEASPRPR